jgi:methylated-DNA-[protein]-cysteine S-methyltransferase
LDLYFKGKLKRFTIPLKLKGTSFQVNAWKQLLKIPYGKVIDYKTQCSMIKNPKAARAIGSANGKNLFPIVIPCHRVVPTKYLHSPLINCGGYAGGKDIKKYLLTFENRIK